MPSAQGREHIVLTDETQGDTHVAIPMILATGAVHSHLVAQGLADLLLDHGSIFGECIDTHYFAVLIGVGATCVNAYLAQDAIADRHASRSARRHYARPSGSELQESDRSRSA